MIGTCPVHDYRVLVRVKRRHRDIYGLFSATDAPEKISLHPAGGKLRTFRLRHVDTRRDRLTDFAYVARPVAPLSSRVSFSPAEWTRLAGLYGFIGALHVLGWGLYLHYAGHYPQLVGLGFVAYMFGLRHAFDADHIAAVDDSVRFMLQKGKKPLGVGFFFSLGHSTVVLVLAIGIAFAATAVKTEIPQLKSMGAIIGASVSGCLLYTSPSPRDR